MERLIFIKNSKVVVLPSIGSTFMGVKSVILYELNRRPTTLADCPNIASRSFRSTTEYILGNAAQTNQNLRIVLCEDYGAPGQDTFGRLITGAWDITLIGSIR